MKKIQIFEPAMCCPTGLCGVGVDEELLRISTVLNSLEKNGVKVDRFNLTDAPMEFINSRKVNDYLFKKGDEKLPVVTLDDEIKIPKQRRIYEPLRYSRKLFESRIR